MTGIRKKNLPAKYLKIWKKSLPFLQKGRPGDAEHAKEVVEIILNYRGPLKLNKDILVPAAIMHDIGHCAILPEHFAFITGETKIRNGKLVHMLAGAKIAHDILTSVKYPPQLTVEIVDIISMHDADQLEGVDIKKIYTSDNKKIFHDIDSLDRYTKKRIASFSKLYPDKNKLFAVLDKFLNLFFYKEFRTIAERQLKALKK